MSSYAEMLEKELARRHKETRMLQTDPLLHNTETMIVHLSGKDWRRCRKVIFNLLDKGYSSGQIVDILGAFVPLWEMEETAGERDGQG